MHLLQVKHNELFADTSLLSGNFQCESMSQVLREVVTFFSASNFSEPSPQSKSLAIQGKALHFNHHY